MRPLFLVALALAMPHALAAQHCRKGIPCGNSCISASRTCRVGQGSATGDRTPTVKPSGLSPTADRYVSGEAPASGQLLQAATEATASEWVALRSGNVYYKATCQAATELPAAEVVRFRTELDAQASGRSASRVVGCH